MPRKRMIDPMIWQDEEFGSLSSGAKILFIGLFSNADDEGRIRANPAYLKSTIFMYDNISQEVVKSKRDEVVEHISSVQLYEVGGKEYIQLKNWNEFQKLHKDRIQSSTLPACPASAGQMPTNVGHLPDNVGLVKVSIVKDSLVENSLVKNDEKNSDEFSEVKKSLGIPDPSPTGITQEFQAEAIRIITALDIPDKRRSAYFKAVQSEPRSYILDAYSFAEDYGNPKLRDQMFFWKLNDIKNKRKEANGEAKPSPS